MCVKGEDETRYGEGRLNSIFYARDSYSFNTCRTCDRYSGLLFDDFTLVVQFF